MVLTSLKTTSEVFAADFKWLPETFQWGNYAQVWTNEKMSLLQTYRNNLKITVLSTAGFLIVSSLAAYGFAKINFKGRNVIFILFLSSIMIPGQVALIPQFMLFRTLGLYNSH